MHRRRRRRAAAARAPASSARSLWPRRLAISKPAPSLPLFGSDSPPVARTTVAAVSSPRWSVVNRGTPVAPCSAIRRQLDTRVTRWRARRRASVAAFAEQGRRARRARDWCRERACRPLLRAGRRRSPGRTRRCRATGKAAQHPADRSSGVPPQKSRSVTTALVTLQRDAAADQNLRAGLARAVEQHDRSRSVGPAREDRRRQTGGAGADDRDVA